MSCMLIFIITRQPAAVSQQIKCSIVLSEPTAAGLAYFLDICSALDPVQAIEEMGNVIGVYDLGGGTFDCSFLYITHGEAGFNFRVIAQQGKFQLSAIFCLNCACYASQEITFVGART